MNRADIKAALVKIREARREWDTARSKFNSDVDAAMSRLVLEAAAARMSVGEVNRASGFSQARVRQFMRSVDLTARGPGMLAKQAATILEENALLLGIEPRDMDLTSPLAYLPAGKELRKSTAANGTGVALDPFLETSYEDAKARIAKALSMGISTGDIPVMDADVDHIAAWLASEGIK